ncbi:MAG: DUF2066 domain-containing protein [Gammaproteobacteria bacterium]|nr:DUF2066 domain-containing protein [Gammaproteobacteria bacterium]
MIFRLSFALLVGLLSGGPVLAVAVEGLYATEVPVMDRSAAATERGVVQALAVVLVKLTGDSANATAAGARPLLARARSYATVVGQAQTGNAIDGYRLRVDFDPAALAAALRERGFVLWAKERPRLQARLVAVDATGQLLALDAAVLAAFDQQAALRGLPLARSSLPVPPTAGETGAWLAELLDGDSAPAVTAPQFAGVLRATPEGQWTADWRVVIAAQTTAWATSDADPVALARAGLNRAGDLVAAHYADAAIFGGEVASFSLRVQGLRDAADYGHMLRLLRGMDVVQRLEVAQVSADHVQLTVNARGGLPALAQSLLLNSQFAPLPNQPSIYQWVTP